MKDKRCLDYGKVIKEGKGRLFSLERRQKKALLRDRMRFLRLLKSGECTTQAQAGKAIGLGLRGAEKLWKQYCSEGVEGLLRYPYEGKKEKLTQEQKQQLHEELLKDNIQGLKQACKYVEEQNGVHYSLSAMHYVFKRLKVKKKSGRPVHYRKDEKGEKRFKKKASLP